ncbi:hypothetical protein RHGRI_029848 [Rhododendron griersonianum]|uniref:Uncharacterized protein n=1 Tax=Rhododendron griersonianum TaxID=479676 RepID=A0AAV6IKW5_9ERIC|nr:hypothetical protein RHGRI_029848 [Rhododendron griersonianum]
MSFYPHLTVWTIGTFSCYVIILQGRLVLRISANSIHHSNTNARHSRRLNISVDAEGDTNQVGDSVIPPLELRYAFSCRRGLTDEFGVEAMMMEALEKVEKELKKPLMRNDKKGMALLMAEFDKINKKLLPKFIKGDNDEIFCSDYFYIRLGIRREDLPKYEEQLERKIAKAQLQVLKKDAIEAMETQKKRTELKDEEMVDVRSLDIRNFL